MRAAGSSMNGDRWHFRKGQVSDGEAALVQGSSRARRLQSCRAATRYPTIWRNSVVCASHPPSGGVAPIRPRSRAPPTFWRGVSWLARTRGYFTRPRLGRIGSICASRDTTSARVLRGCLEKSFSQLRGPSHQAPRPMAFPQTFGLWLRIAGLNRMATSRRAISSAILRAAVRTSGGTHSGKEIAVLTWRPDFS